jgi:hypothetical protein
MSKMFKGIMDTFEDKEDYLQNQQMQAMLGQAMWGGNPWQMPTQQAMPNNPAELTQQVAGGQVTAGMPV